MLAWRSSLVTKARHFRNWCSITFIPWSFVENCPCGSLRLYGCWELHPYVCYSFHRIPISEPSHSYSHYEVGILFWTKVCWTEALTHTHHCVPRAQPGLEEMTEGRHMTSVTQISMTHHFQTLASPNSFSEQYLTPPPPQLAPIGGLIRQRGTQHGTPVGHRQLPKLTPKVLPMEGKLFQKWLGNY